MFGSGSMARHLIERRKGPADADVLT
ncbi:uncharacterized protein METZ01_LOCUS220330 [marine metagenome]|uniref:Uncharacterized protein n=1 Tax=marine metagenome TaxID=408172 RepID=A0A382FWK8_9ZZZZ